MIEIILPDIFLDISGNSLSPKSLHYFGLILFLYEYKAIKSLTNCYLINWFFIPSASRAFHNIMVQQIQPNTAHTHIDTYVQTCCNNSVDKEREGIDECIAYNCLRLFVMIYY